MGDSTQQSDFGLRRLAGPDFDFVVALNSAHSGRSRRIHCGWSLKEALARPELHLRFPADQDGMLAGFMMAR